MQLMILFALLPSIAGHTAIVSPPPRNAVDRNVELWSGAVPEPVIRVSAKGGWWCPIAGESNGKFSAALGQACFWFSNGAAIGCKTPDGNTRGPEACHRMGNQGRPNANGTYGIDCNQNTTTLLSKPPSCVCNNSDFKATICDPKLRTMNIHTECGSSADYTYFSPWRAPGSAGVFDACGMAGGRPGGGGAHGATYKDTVNAKAGDLGSKVLRAMPTKTTWQAGSVVEVSWAITANHGGGYQYRLCPADEALTEDCFQKRPLPFVGRQRFRWGGPKGKEMWFNGTYVSEGTIPKGSMWAKNPVPRNGAFEPICDEVPNCGDSAIESKCRCSGMWGPYDLEIVDLVQLPADLEPGDWVLGWRNDCEESNQIWNSCSDVTIVAGLTTFV